LLRARQVSVPRSRPSLGRVTKLPPGAAPAGVPPAPNVTSPCSSIHTCCTQSNSRPMA
jgi:hypothetical protein